MVRLVYVLMEAVAQRPGAGKLASAWRARPESVHSTPGRCHLWPIQTMVVESIFGVAKPGRINSVTSGCMMSYSLKGIVVLQSLKLVILHGESLVHQPVF